MFPRLNIYLDRLAENVRIVTGLCAKHGLNVTGITKGVRGDPIIARVMVENGVTGLGDSRVENLSKLAGLGVERWLIRMPMISTVEDVVRNCEVSLNTEESTILALDKACGKFGLQHKIVLMYDLGDLREGYVGHDTLKRAAEVVRKCPNLELSGIGTNLTCFNFIEPDTEKLTELVDAGKEIGATTYVSGGNSATIGLMMRGGIPKGVNLLRLGESLLFGRERMNYAYLDGTHNDVFQLEAEIIELKDKPSVPWGTMGKDSYGRYPKKCIDRGIRRRAICALGRQDTDCEVMSPMDPGIEMLGASSDHLMLDVTDAQRDYKVGDTITFRLGYFALMRAYTSDYVEHRFIRK